MESIDFFWKDKDKLKTLEWDCASADFELSNAAKKGESAFKAWMTLSKLAGAQ